MVNYLQLHMLKIETRGKHYGTDIIRTNGLGRNRGTDLFRGGQSPCDAGASSDGQWGTDSGDAADSEGDSGKNRYKRVSHGTCR